VSDGDTVRIRLHHPARGVAKGQAAVLYAGDAVLGSATISATSPTAAPPTRVPASSGVMEARLFRAEKARFSGASCVLPLLLQQQICIVRAGWVRCPFEERL